MHLFLFRASFFASQMDLHLRSNEHKQTTPKSQKKVHGHNRETQHVTNSTKKEGSSMTDLTKSNHTAINQKIKSKR